MKSVTTAAFIALPFHCCRPGWRRACVPFSASDTAPAGARREGASARAGTDLRHPGEGRWPLAGEVPARWHGAMTTTGSTVRARRAAAARPMLPAQRTPVDGRVVVGVDGTPASVAALDWALRLAHRRGWTLDVVAAWPDPAEVFVREVPGHFNQPRNRVRESVDRALATVARGRAAPRTRLFVENIHPVEALLEHSDGAQLLVLGDSRWAQPRSSTVARACARLASCPVVLVAAPSGTPSGP